MIVNGRLNQPQNYKTLLSYLVEEPKEKDDDDRKYRLPQMAFLFLDAMPQHALLNRLLTDLPKEISSEVVPRQFVDYLLSFFLKVEGYKEETQSLLAGYISRVLIKMSENKPKETLICLYFENFVVFESLAKSSNLKPLCDLLVALLLLDLKELNDEAHIVVAKVEKYSVS